MLESVKWGILSNEDKISSWGRESSINLLRLWEHRQSVLELKVKLSSSVSLISQKGKILLLDGKKFRLISIAVFLVVVFTRRTICHSSPKNNLEKKYCLEFAISENKRAKKSVAF